MLLVARQLAEQREQYQRQAGTDRRAARERCVTSRIVTPRWRTDSISSQVSRRA